MHGPTPRDYSWGMPKRMRRNAVRSVLAQKLREGKMICVEQFELDTHRTGDLEQALASGLGVSAKALLVPLDDERNLSLAARNNQRLSVVRALGVSVVDLMSSDTVVISEAALQRLCEVLIR